MNTFKNRIKFSPETQGGSFRGGDSCYTANLKAPQQFIKRGKNVAGFTTDYRSDFMRDRDRILYSRAFRRLAGKTQIYTIGGDDHQKNRLTHTLEVSQIARTISKALNLDCDLTEAIALGHDLGHTPFGHAGEKILHEIMSPESTISIPDSPMKKVPRPMRKKDYYGFKHNVQSVRVVATIEDNYPEQGLNLTNYTLWGILNHTSLKYKENRVDTDCTDPTYKNIYNKHYLLGGYSDKEAWSFEAFVVKEADEIAQRHHDLEDALLGGAMNISDVYNAVRTTLDWLMSEEDRQKLQALAGRLYADRAYITAISSVVVNTLVSRVVRCSRENLSMLWEEVHDKTNPDEFFVEHSVCEKKIKQAIGYSILENKTDTETEKKRKEKEAERVEQTFKNFEQMIREKVHHSADVERMNAKGTYIIRKMFQAYYKHPQQLPDGVVLHYMIDIGRYTSLKEAYEKGIGTVRTEFEELITSKNGFTYEYKIKLMRRICDHISGMTDRYALQEYGKLY